MKIKTAIKESISSLKFLSFAIVGMVLLSVKYPTKYTIIPTGVLIFYFVIDAWNVYYIRKKAAKDPSYLDQRMK